MTDKLVSVIMPVYNCQDFIEECIESILTQDLMLSLNEEISVEICIYEDGSTDRTSFIIDEQRRKLLETRNKKFSINLFRNESGSPKGVGHGRNQAIAKSTGDFLCFCDGDDVMLPKRIITQYKLAVENLNAIIGSKYVRYPEDSTKIFTTWATQLTPLQLYTQIFLSFGPTLVMPTWFFHRSVYNKIQGGFDETAKGAPEDLIFFFNHLNSGGKLVRAEETLMVYRYHPLATTFSISEETIWSTRIAEIQSRILSKWSRFSIWNAGKLGRKFFRSLKEENQVKVVSFCDVDAKKIHQKLYHPYPLKITVPIVHVKDAQPPFIICVKTELTLQSEGSFKRHLESLNLKEGLDFYFFN